MHQLLTLLAFGLSITFATDISEQFLQRVLELPIMENPLLLEHSSPFADSLAQFGFLSLSAEEYEREVFLHPTQPISDYAAYQSAICHLKMGNYEYADRILDELSYKALRRDVAYRASVLSALIDIKMGYPKAARASLKVALREFPEWKAETHFWLGWCYICSYEWSEAKTEFETICSDATAENYFIARAYGALRYLEIYRLDEKERSPYTARWLSAIIPGAGQVYAGSDVGSAISSFALNFVFGGMTISYLFKKEYLQSALVFLLGWNRYYFGGITSAYFSAEKYNSMKEKKMAEFLIRTLILEEDDTHTMITDTDTTMSDVSKHLTTYHNALSTVARCGITLYKDFISGQDAQHCQFKLSCSSFAMYAFEHKNPLLAMMMTSDRLLRCNPFAQHNYPMDLSGKLLDYEWQYQNTESSTEKNN